MCQSASPVCPAPPDVPDLTFAAIPGHPQYLLASDRSLWSSRRKGRPSSRAMHVASWRRISTHEVGRKTKRARVALWDGKALVYFRLDELYSRLFGRACRAVAA